MVDDLFADISGDNDLFGDIPALKGRPGVRAALRDLTKNDAAFAAHRERKGGSGKGGRNEDTASERYLNSATLGMFRQLQGGIGAGITAIQSAVPGGKQPTYTARDMYDATRILQEARQRKFAGEHPGVALGVDVAGALQMPGASAIGKFVVGKAAPAAVAAGKPVSGVTRLAQTGRASLAGGALGGTQSGALAAPGEEIAEARRGATTGAVLAPVAGLVGGGVGAGVSATRKGLQRLAGTRTAEITSVEKLQTALRQAGVTPDAIQKAADEWAQMGGVTPAVIDIVKDAGGSSEVLRLLQRSAAKAPVRLQAEKYAEETVGGTQKKALAQVEALPTGGETRTPSEIRAAIGSEKEAIGTKLADDQARIAADQVAGTPPIPEAPLPRESGAAAFAEDLNRKYDVSEKAYKAAYAEAEKAQPELAVVEVGEVRPLFDKLRGALRGLNPRLEGVGSVTKEIEHLKGKIAPGETGDWPEGEAMDNAAPLTVQDLEFLRQKMVELADKYGGATGSAGATRVKQVVDDELTRLAAENKFTGDPKVVEAWKNAINGYAQHKQTFGSGLSAKLTERKPDGTRVVEPFRAGEVIFGTGDKASRNLNTLLSDLDKAIETASPEAVAALRQELYGRVKPGDLAKLRETTGGKRLLPEDLTDEALAAQQAAQAAEVRAAEDAAAAEASAAAQTQGLERGEENALNVGEKALAMPSEQFEPAVGAVENQHLPVVAAGAKQAVLNAVEKPAPDKTGALNAMLSTQATKNLGLAVSPRDVALMQARLKAVQRQGQNAQSLEKAAGASALHTDPLLETVTTGDIAYQKRGAVDAVLKALRLQSRLSNDEYQAALRTLTANDPQATQTLLSGLLKKYPAAKRAISPMLAKAVSGAPGDTEADTEMQDEYGVP